MLDLCIKLAKVTRVTALSLLFAGSGSIVFAAITLVKAGEANGLTVSQAATANAPIFIQFSKVVLVACLVLLIVELIDIALVRPTTRIKWAEYAMATLCCICGFIFALHTAPLMEHLLGYVNVDPAIKESFQQLHQLSRILFGGIILFAWLTMVIPIFGLKCTRQMAGTKSGAEPVGEAGHKID